MEYLPMFMNLRGKRALVVGGGVIASRKATLLASCGAEIRVVSPDISNAMTRWAQDANATIVQRAYQDADLDGAVLVIAATDDASVNRQVHDDACRRNLPVNVADQTDLCTFILPAIVDRSPVIVAVSTGGRSPVLARFTKAMLERLVPQALGSLAQFCGRWRDAFKRRIADESMRRRAWETFFESEVPELIYAGNRSEAENRVNEIIEQANYPQAKKGAVYLIGAGPGDPELMTLRGQRLLQRADVVLYDRLVPIDVLQLCRREAELIYVGKRHGDHPVPQDEITQQLIDYALEGKRVARLKGGDPFVFGRGGEEIEALAGHGIDFEVVPGISAANGCAAYSGIPLTHRDHAQGFSCWTGHLKNGALDLDWEHIAGSRQTQVFFMGLRAAETISRELIGHGLPATTPVALVAAGTTRQQQVWRCSLKGLPAEARKRFSDMPTLIIVGTVVNLRRSLSWFQGSDSPSPVFPRHSAANERAVVADAR